MDMSTEKLTIAVEYWNLWLEGVAGKQVILLLKNKEKAESILKERSHAK
jgi:hypothetical protein